MKLLKPKSVFFSMAEDLNETLNKVTIRIEVKDKRITEIRGGGCGVKGNTSAGPNNYCRLKYHMKAIKRI
jgi:hypothetical protein